MRAQMKEERVKKKHAAGKVTWTTGRCENVKCRRGMVISKCPSELDRDDENERTRRKQGKSPKEVRKREKLRYTYIPPLWAIIRLGIPTAQDDERPLRLAGIVICGPRRRKTISLTLPLALILPHDNERPSRGIAITKAARRTSLLVIPSATVAMTFRPQRTIPRLFLRCSQSRLG